MNQEQSNTQILTDWCLKWTPLFMAALIVTNIVVVYLTYENIQNIESKAENYLSDIKRHYKYVEKTSVDIKRAKEDVQNFLYENDVVELKEYIRKK